MEAWRRAVLAPPAAPPVLPDVLRPYQKRGVEWLAHLCDVGCHSLLADEMGLGKTLQVLALLAARPLAGQPALVVCPASVVPVWREETVRFFPHLKVDVLKAGHDFSSRTDDVVWLASYTQLRKHRELLPAHEFGYVVLDEGQFIKNPDAKITQTCFAIRARHRVVLTGTPLENRQLDLWSIFRFLLPGLLGTRAAFEAALHKDRAGTIDRLRAQLAPFILRRAKREVATELPPKVEMDLLCPLTDVQRAEYARICSEGLERLGDDVGTVMREKSFGFLALLTRLRQTCCDPDMLPWRKSPLADSGKITLLMEKLAEIVASGHKVVIFSQFVMLLNRVRAAMVAQFPDLARFELTGMTLDRQKPVASFQNAPGAAAMLVSLKAAGTGITLHAADYVFLLDPWWNPAVEAQAVDRVHRIGQTNTVFVYRMVTSGTIEERIQALKADKKDLFDKLIGGLGGDFDLSQHFTSLQSLVQLTAQADQEPETYTLD
jgi:SNF2 family DNA or RNA helicase